MKVFLKLFLLLALAVYLVFAFVRFCKSKADVQCDKVTIVISDADKADFVSEQDIRQILKDTKLEPQGKNLSDINLVKIKKAVDSHQFVHSSICYTRPNGELIIELSQRLPVLRVMPDKGEQYYIDANANRIQHASYPADVIVVTGNVNYDKAKKYLVTLAGIVQQDEFWNDMIEQVNITRDGKLELSPRLGNHVVALGYPQDIPQKLARLKTFYQKVINQVGWQKYSRISLEYENQVVCTKSE